MNERLTKTWLLIGAGAALVVTLARADDREAPPKDHVLFLGLNLSVRRNDNSGPVVGADDSSVQVLESGRRARLFLRDVEHFQIDVLPKVSKESVAIEALHEERCYGPNSDPQKQAMHQQMIRAKID